jgi:hypothetical protein
MLGTVFSTFQLGGSVMSKPVALVAQPDSVEVEDGIRGILRRADTELRRERGEGSAPSIPTSQNPAELVRRVAGTSAEEVERVVLELQNLSELLRSEGDRVNREVEEYIKLNGHATSAMQVVSTALKQLSDAIPTTRT